MGIDVLGPLRIDGNGVVLQRRDQVVLSVLVVRAGEVVSPDRLAEALWPDSPPATWAKVIQGSVFRLRRTLGSSLIETAPGGYRLAVRVEELDSQQFEQLVGRGRLLFAAGEADRAAVALARALELWRGAPFEVVESWPPGQIAAAQLEELRRTAEESLIEARLSLGEHRDVVPIAEARVREEPLREHRWALLALALYRCGRQADALRALKRARHTLVEQLGIEPGAELAALEAAILRQDENLLAPPEPPAIAEHCPYKGLAPYDVDDTDTFFGRDGEIATCLQRLAENPLLVVTGPSGCGKSSLVRAGLVPALRRAGYTAAVFSPGRDPSAALASALAAADGSPVLVVDQFEELLTGFDDSGGDGRGFCALLAAYAVDKAPVVVAVRADHVASLAVDPSFARLAERGLHLVTPLAGDPLRHAIAGPAEQAGLRLEHGLVDLLVRDCEGEPGALPLLSHALAETWQRRDGRVLTVEAYRATGEIRGAVARTADRLYESLAAEQRPKLRSVLMRLVSPTADGEPMRARVPTRTLEGDPDRAWVLGLLVRARLVTAEQDSVEIAHEALARAWPRLRSWLDEDAAGQRILRHLSAAAEGWDSLGRPESELYRGARLEAVNEWRAATSPDLTDDEELFLDASIAAVERERRRAAAAAAAEARQRRRHRAALAGVAVLLVAAVGGGFVAYQQRRSSDRETRDAEVRSLATTSQALRSTQPDLAALLALEGHSIAPSAATESALFGTFTAAPGLRRTTRTDVDLGQTNVGGAYLPDGETIVTSDRRGSVHLINLADGHHEQLSPLSDQRGGHSVLDVSSDGRYVAVVWYSYQERNHSLTTVWDLGTGDRRFEPVRIAGRRASVAVSPDGSFIAVSGDEDLPTEIRDGATGGLLRTVAALPPPLGIARLTTASVAFAPDGRLAVGSRAGPIRFVDPSTGDELERFDAPPRSSDVELRFDAEGSVVVAAGHERFINFDAETGRRRSIVVHDQSTCRSLVYSAAIEAVLCVKLGHVTAFNTYGNEVAIPNHVDRGEVCGLIASTDGRRLAELTACSDEGGATIREWLLDGGGAISHRAIAVPLGFYGVQGYGYAGDSSALRAWTEVGGSMVVDSTTGDVIAEFAPEVFDVLPGEDPDVGYAIVGDRSVGLYDVEEHNVLTEVDVGFATSIWAHLDNLIAFGGGAGGDFDDPIVHLRVVEFAGDVEPALGSLIDGRGEFKVVGLALDEFGLLAAVMLEDRGELRIERRDPVTGELVGEPAVGYRDVASAGGVTVFVRSDGRLLQVDPRTLKPVGLPFGQAGVDEWPLLDDQGRRLAVAPGGLLAPAASGDGSLRLYDVASRTQLGTEIDLGARDFRHVTFRSDGRELAFDTDHGIIVWNLDTDRWVEAACEVAGRNLTETEWDQYIGDLAAYRATCPQFASG